MNIKSPDKFYVNGVSSATVGLYTDTPPVPPMANQRYSQYQITADTDYISPDDSFESTQITLKCYTFYNDDFDNRAIYNFLYPAKTLKTSRFDDYYYKVQAVSVAAPTSSYNGGKIQYKITFLCEPFKYAISNDIQDVTNGGIITNAGNRYSKPLFIVEGSGEVRLTVQGRSFTLLSLSGAAAIDSSVCLAYTQNQIINPYTTGDFPILYPGNNAVSWTGTVARVTVQKNERWY